MTTTTGDSLLDSPVVRCAHCVHARQKDVLTQGKSNMRWCDVHHKVRALTAARQCDDFEHPLTPAAVEAIAREWKFIDFPHAFRARVRKNIKQGAA